MEGRGQDPGVCLSPNLRLGDPKRNGRRQTPGGQAVLVNGQVFPARDNETCCRAVAPETPDMPVALGCGRQIDRIDTARHQLILLGNS